MPTPRATTPFATTPRATTPFATTPRATTPYATTPRATTPFATTPRATTPFATTPAATTPFATTPFATTPAATTPYATTPAATTPYATTPTVIPISFFNPLGSNIYPLFNADTNPLGEPNFPTPKITTPFATTPFATTPYATTPFATTPFATTPYATTPFATTPYATTPAATTPYATTPFATTPYATTPFATTPAATTPYATTPYATTPYATTPFATTPAATTPRATTPFATTPRATTPRATTPRATTPAATTPPYEDGYSAVYSMRLVVPKYTGPVVRIKKVGSAYDFLDIYTDNEQNSFYYYNTMGVKSTYNNYATATDTVYVLIWYDQTGDWNSSTKTNNNSCNATQPTTTNAPIIAKITKKIDNTTSQDFYVIQWTKSTNNCLTFSTAIKPKTVFCHFYNDNSLYGTILESTSTGPCIRFGGSSKESIMGDSNQKDWFYSCSDTRSAYVSSATEYVIKTGINTNNNSISFPDWNTLVLSTTTPPTFNGFTTIGKDINSSDRSINGYMVEILFRNADPTKEEEKNAMSQYINKKLFWNSN